MRCNQKVIRGIIREIIRGVIRRRHQEAIRVLDHVLQPALRCNQMQSEGHQSVLDHVLQPALRVPLHRRPEGLEGNVVEPAEQVAA